MKIGYARVSRQDQRLEPQRDALLADGCERVFEEKVSSREAERTKLLEAFDWCREGDVLVVARLDRLGEVAKGNLRELEPVTEDNGASMDTAPGRQRAFGEVASFLRDRFGWLVDPEAEAECRSVAREEAGLDAFGQPALPAAADDASGALATPDHPSRGDIPETVGTEERYLDAEIVAIYW